MEKPEQIELNKVNLDIGESGDKPSETFATNQSAVFMSYITKICSGLHPSKQFKMTLATINEEDEEAVDEESGMGNIDTFVNENEIKSLDVINLTK